MTVTHKQVVVIEVTDNDHHAKFERYVEGHWPGHVVQPIAEIIREVADDIIAHIERAEAEL